MSLARVHSFSISLDGFGTGEKLSQDAPFGHAGQKLHEWMIATRWWDPGDSGVVVADSTTGSIPVNSPGPFHQPDA